GSRKKRPVAPKCDWASPTQTSAHSAKACAGAKCWTKRKSAVAAGGSTKKARSNGHETTVARRAGLPAMATGACETAAAVDMTALETGLTGPGLAHPGRDAGMTARAEAGTRTPT